MFIIRRQQKVIKVAARAASSFRVHAQVILGSAKKDGYGVMVVIKNNELIDEFENM